MSTISSAIICLSLVKQVQKLRRNITLVIKPDTQNTLGMAGADSTEVCHFHQNLCPVYGLVWALGCYVTLKRSEN